MGSFIGAMRRGIGRGEADPSPTSSTEVGNEWSYNSISPNMPSWCAKARLYLSLLPGRRKCSYQCTAIMAFVTHFMVNVATTFEAGVVSLYTCILLKYKMVGDGLSLAS